MVPLTMSLLPNPAKDKLTTSTFKANARVERLLENEVRGGAVVVEDLERVQPDAGSNAGDALGVGVGGDDPGHGGAMAGEIGRVLVRNEGLRRDATGEVRMVEINARVQDGDPGE